MVMKFGYPFESILNIQRALEDSMTSDWFGPSTSSRGGFPPINVFRENNSYIVIAELSGVSRDAINVEIHRRQVRLSGNKEINYGEKVSIHRREREAGNFDRTISLPFEVDRDNVKAEYRDGVLVLHLSRAEQDKPRSIAID
ncbi:MAG: Hsp20/alpha crystallin family protein [Gammaproteobacteria bacterium]|nr:Hsp20/alpha crystallin family protein [Gammaproteobacteria bacterium]